MSHAPLLRFTDVAPLRAEVAGWRRAGARIVLVPTMGALHAGHLALMARARELGQRVVASIFVNPTQFGPNEDFSRYPRDTETDLSLLAEAGVDAAYLPEVSGMYPESFSTRIEVEGLTKRSCGAYRPGTSISGVATVVTKLLNRVQPDVALFGEKDFQQLLVIRRALRDLDLRRDEIQGVPTLREADGLALSSRNRYLDADAPRPRAAPPRRPDRHRAGDGGGWRGRPTPGAGPRRSGGGGFRPGAVS